MALIKCKECGKEISSKATSCPHCGYKNPKKVIEYSLQKNIKTGSILCIIGSSLLIAWTLIVIFANIFDYSSNTTNQNVQDASYDFTIDIKVNGGTEEPTISSAYYIIILVLSLLIMTNRHIIFEKLY